MIDREKLIDHAAAMGRYAVERDSGKEPKIAGKIADIRGHGLFLGIELKDAPQKLVEKGLEKGVLINLTAQKVIRLRRRSTSANST